MKRRRGLREAIGRRRKCGCGPAGRPSPGSRARSLGLGAVAAVGIGGAVFLALRPQHQTAGSELYNTSNRTTPDGLANLPRDYAGIPRAVPQLGPPLPGDLGRPIVNAGAPAPGMPTRQAGPSPEQQRIAQEMEAARTSHLFATTNVGQNATVDFSGAAGGSGRHGAIDRRVERSRLPGSQARFPERECRSRHGQPRPRAGARQFVHAAGRRGDPGALLTGMRSDLPGQITAQVTENVYDSPTGKVLLIPQGARLIGQYDTQVAFGQSRALLVWNRLIMPNGRSIVLERQPGADADGYSGLEDEVDNHWGMLFKAAMLSTLLSVGSEAAPATTRELARPGAAAGRVPELQPDRPAGRRPLSEHPADPDDPAGFPGARDRQPRSRARTLSRLRRRTWRS